MKFHHLLILAMFLALAESGMVVSRIDIRERGAKGDGLALDTAAIQKALDDCAAIPRGI